MPRYNLSLKLGKVEGVQKDLAVQREREGESGRIQGGSHLFIYSKTVGGYEMGNWFLW